MGVTLDLLFRFISYLLLWGPETARYKIYAGDGQMFHKVISKQKKSFIPGERMLRSSDHPVFPRSLSFIESFIRTLQAFIQFHFPVPCANSEGQG